MSDNRNEDPNPIWILLLLVVIVAIVLSFAPGMFILGIAKYRMGIEFDTGQMWIFSVVLNCEKGAEKRPESKKNSRRWRR